MRKRHKMRTQPTLQINLFLTVLLMGLWLPGPTQGSGICNSDNCTSISLNLPQNSYYQPHSTNQQNSPGRQTNNLNPAIWSDDDDFFTLEESEGNLKFAHQTNRLNGVTAIELLPSLFSETSQFHRPHIYLITTCLRI